MPYKAAPSNEPAAAPPDTYFHPDVQPLYANYLARGIEKLGEGVTQAGEQWGQVQLDGQINKAMKAVDEKTDNFTKLQGQEALEQQESYKHDIDQTVGTYGDQLPPYLKSKFDAAIRRYQYSYSFGKINTHADQQGKEVTKKTNNDTVNQSVELAAANYNNPEVVKSSIADAIHGYQQQVIADGNGGVPEEMARAERMGTEQVYKSVAEAMYAHNAPNGYAFVKQYEKELGLYAAPLLDKFRARGEAIQSEQRTDALQKINGAANPAVKGALIKQYENVLGPELTQSLTGQPQDTPAAGGNVVPFQKPGESPQDLTKRLLQEGETKAAPPPAARLPNESFQDWKKRDSQLNFAPQKKEAAAGAIDDALRPTVDAHTDRNLFSSGAARRKGIEGGVGEHLVSIGANPEDGSAVKVNARAAPHFKGFIDELQSMGYKINSLGGFADRMKRGGFGGGYSEHAFGNAIDINPNQNPQGGGTNLPPNVGAIAAKYGLIWGGDWRGASRDPMHFEWSGKEAQVAGQ